MNGRRRSTVLLALLATMLILVPFRAGAQDDGTVYGLFFYSPACPHCHDVLENDWPAIEEEFGDALVVLFVDASTPDGGAIMDQALTAMAIDSNGVPMLIIGDTVMVGAIDIPAMTPDVVRRALSSGGSGYPPIPGIDAVFESVIGPTGDTTPGSSPSTIPGETTTPPADDGAIVTDAAAAESSSLADRFANDLLANLVAVALLLLLIAVLIAVAVAVAGGWPPARPAWARIATVITSAAGVVVAAVLLPATTEEPITAVLALGLLAAFAAVLVRAVRATVPVGASWYPGALLLTGIGASAYLATVEVADRDAACGLVGDCNLVQQSSYAKIAGIPIGVIGVVTYAAMLVLWLVARQTASRPAAVVLWTIAVGGAAFSTYLTFLEPFVIGATCLWCLSSAAIIALLAWLLWPDPRYARLTR